MTADSIHKRRHIPVIDWSCRIPTCVGGIVLTFSSHTRPHTSFQGHGMTDITIFTHSRSHVRLKIHVTRLFIQRQRHGNNPLQAYLVFPLLICLSTVKRASKEGKTQADWNEASDGGDGGIKFRSKGTQGQRLPHRRNVNEVHKGGSI